MPNYVILYDIEMTLVRQLEVCVLCILEHLPLAFCYILYF